MRNNIGRDLMATILIYGAYFGLLYAVYSTKALIDTFGVSPGAVGGTVLDGEAYREDFHLWALSVMAVSFVLTLVWYGIGEWGMKSHRVAEGTKLMIWGILLLLTLLAGAGAVSEGPPAELNSHIPMLIQVLGGSGFFYLATALFSPETCKYVPPGASWFRRW
jgi:hypothetical protein